MMTDRTDIDLDDIRRRLEAELIELKESSGTTADDRKPVELDQQSVGRLSRMDALQSQAMANAVEERRKGRALKIAAALGRIEEGEYGYCVVCGEEIARKRLEIDLTTARCVACAS